MNLSSTIKMSIKSILSNKMRTFLTMLGIIIGVLSVIVLVSLGQGTTASVTESIESMGSNMISVYITDRSERFDYDDVMEISNIEGVNNVTPVISNNVNAKYGLEDVDVNIKGVNENYLEINNYELDYGRFISPIDIDYRNKIVILGTDTAEELFGTVNPVGEKISINGEKYTVAGVLAEKEDSMFGSSNELIIAPATTVMRQFKTDTIGEITVQGESADTSATTVENLESYLLDIFEDEDSYKVFNQADLLSTIGDVTKTLTLMLGGIAGISLLVGGIGIMNIMLVTVTERTREIGIRKAIGAKRSSILTQFLIESSVISCMGGIIGIILGLAVNSLIATAMGLTTVISIQIIGLAFGFSLAVGIFFGMYPANKASKLKPVDALRYE